MPKPLVVLTFLALCMSATIVAQSQLPRAMHASDLPLARLHPAMLSALSFGHPQTLADILYLQAISLWGGYSTKAQNYLDLGPALERITTLDPSHRGVYLLAGTALSLEGMDQQLGLRLLRQGIEVYPNDWRLLFFLGFNLYDLQHDVHEATQWLARAAIQPGAPAHLPMLVATLSSKAARQDVAIAMLQTLLQQTDDEEHKEIYVRRIERLQASKAQHDALMKEPP